MSDGDTYISIDPVYYAYLACARHNGRTTWRFSLIIVSFCRRRSGDDFSDSFRTPFRSCTCLLDGRRLFVLQFGVLLHYQNPLRNSSFHHTWFFSPWVTRGYSEHHTLTCHIAYKTGNCFRLRFRSTLRPLF